jgi:hypothetical protein
VPRLRRPIFVSPDSDEALVKTLGMGDRRNKLKDIALETGLPQTIVQRILTKRLGLRKILNRWVPRLLQPGK